MSETTPDHDHDVECAAVLDRVHQFLDHELDEASCDQIRHHLDACEQCLDNFDAESAIKQLVNRCCQGDAAPDGLRATIMQKIRQD
ncbi:hypothetical protein GCM10027418_14240 [Mariniluteicoccus endophyticus]